MSIITVHELEILCIIIITKGHLFCFWAFPPNRNVLIPYLNVMRFGKTHHEIWHWQLWFCDHTHKAGFKPINLYFFYKFACNKQVIWSRLIALIFRNGILKKTAGLINWKCSLQVRHPTGFHKSHNKSLYAMSFSSTNFRFHTTKLSSYTSILNICSEGFVNKIIPP